MHLSNSRAPRWFSGEFLSDESELIPTADGNLASDFFLSQSADDPARRITSQSLSGYRGAGGGMRPGSALYSDFIRNAALGYLPTAPQEIPSDDDPSNPDTADLVGETFFTAGGRQRADRGLQAQGLSGLGLTENDILRDPRAYGFVTIDDDEGSPSGDWSNSNGSLIVGGRLVDYGNMTAMGSSGVLPQGGSTIGTVNTVAGPSWLDQILNRAPDIMKGITTAQLSQINLDRAARGLPPLTTGQVLGVAGAPPAITTQSIMLLGAGLVAVMMLGKK